MSPITAKTYTAEVICLRTFDFGEADKILHLYSPVEGRISAIAKGVKRQNSKLAGACELLNLSEVQLSKGKNLDVLCQYQPKESFAGVRADILKLAYGLLFGEFILQTTADADADSQQIFDGLKHILQLLDEAREAELVPRALSYQLRWLESAGYHPVLNACIFTGSPLDWNAVYHCFSAEVGGVTSPEQKNNQQAQQKIGPGPQWVNVSTSTLKLLNNPEVGEWSPLQLYKAQKFLRYYFKQVFEKSLNAYDLIFNLLEMGLPSAQG